MEAGESGVDGEIELRVLFCTFTISTIKDGSLAVKASADILTLLKKLWAHDTWRSLILVAWYPLNGTLVSVGRHD